MPARTPQNPFKIPPRVCGDLKVKNKVFGGGSEKLAGICLTEMQQLFLCFKKFTFNEEACAQEIKNFNGCYYRHIKSYHQPSNSKHSGKTSAADLTKLLQRFPERLKDKY